MLVGGSFTFPGELNMARGCSRRSALHVGFCGGNRRGIDFCGGANDEGFLGPSCAAMEARNQYYNRQFDVLGKHQIKIFVIGDWQR